MGSHGAPGETQVDMDGSLISPVLKDGGIWWNRSRCLRFLGSLTSVIKSFKAKGEERRKHQNSCPFHHTQSYYQVC